MKIAEPTRAAAGAAALLFVTGLVARVAPLFDAGGRLLRQFPTEDGYLMLTIARNIALGHGMSVSEGLLATNGTQPLATFLWAGLFRLAGADRWWGVFWILCVEIVLACLSAWLLYGLARRVFAELAGGEGLARLAAAAWFASPVVVSHSMNCLETGLYAVAVIAVATAFLESPRAEPWSIGRCLGFGGLLGFAFWTRNDAVFLILAVCLVHTGWGLADPRKPVTRRFAETLVFGATSVAVAAPWLVYNWLHFGGIVPVSAQSEALDAKFGENLALIPAAVFEYATLYLPIPQALETSKWALALGSLACLVVAALVWRVIRTGSPTARVLAWVGAIYGVCLLVFYGTSFGAGYFFSRYAFPVSPFLALLLVAVLRRLWLASDSRGFRLAPLATVTGLCAFALALDARLYWNGTYHMHFQVVDWVQEHVPDDVWVAAPQSGTLGFFHDRTLNLDGKVNPAALAVRRADGEVTRYVLETTDIQYLADWQGLASWARQPRIAAQFELVVDDPAKNLAVLRRRGVASN